MQSLLCLNFLKFNFDFVSFDFAMASIKNKTKIRLFQNIQHIYLHYFSEKVPVNKLTLDVMVVNVRIRMDLFNGRSME